MQDFEQYIKPELLTVVAVLYIIGMMIKNTKAIKNKYIPMILGIVGIFICSFYISAIDGFSMMGIFSGVTQGIITAGVAVYTNQLIDKQPKKKE